MFFCVERTALLEAVSKLQRVVGSKTSMPVLEGILISAEQGKITLISYNLDMGIKKEIYAKCDQPGDIVINAKLLGDILRRLNGLSVEIEADSKLNCHIKSGDATFDIMGMAATDFPEMPTVGANECISIDSEIMTDMIKTTAFAAAQTEGIKPILMGVNFSVKDSILQIVAVDGYRLAIKKAPVEGVSDIMFTVSSKSVAELLKLVEESDGNVDIFLGERLISFSCNGYFFISRLMEGEYVDHNKILPKKTSQRVTVKTKDLINIIERVSLLINDSFATPVRCYFNELNVVFTCATSMGRATETYDTKLEGESFEIGLNSRYLLDALRAIDIDDIEILFDGPNSGILMKPLDSDRFRYMIMPMRLK